MARRKLGLGPKREHLRSQLQTRLHRQFRQPTAQRSLAWVPGWLGVVRTFSQVAFESIRAVGAGWMTHNQRVRKQFITRLPAGTQSVKDQLASGYNIHSVVIGACPTRQGHNKSGCSELMKSESSCVVFFKEPSN